jgi:hypothetical protein
MKDNLTHILEAFDNTPSLSKTFDSAPLFKDVIDNIPNIGSRFHSAPLFNNIFTNMPEFENFRLSFNLIYRQLYLDSASAEDFFNRIVSFNRLFEDIAELVDTIEKFHPPITLEEEQFFAFQDFFDILITQSRYLENLNVRSLALEAKSILSSERILTADIPAKKLPPITLEEEQFFAAIGDIDLELLMARSFSSFVNVRESELVSKAFQSSERILISDIISAAKRQVITLEEEQFFASIGDIDVDLLRATIFTSFVNARESELVSKAFQFFDRSRISDDEIKKLLNVNTEEDEFTALDDYLDILYGLVISGGPGGSTDKINVRDSFLSATPLLTRDKISNSDLRLLEVRPDIISEIIDSLDEQKNLFGKNIFELKRLKDTFLKANSFISSDKFFTDSFPQNFYGIAFTEAENEERKEELLELSAGGEGVRRTGEVTEDDYSLVKFFVELNSVRDFSFLKDFFLTPAVPFITKDSAFFISGIDNLFVDKSPRDLVSISALRKDVFFFFKLAGILESLQIKDSFLTPAAPRIRKDTVDINDTSIVKTRNISKTYPQFFHPKGSNQQFQSKIGVYHPFYSPQDNPVQITGDVYRSAPAPWEDFVQIGSDGSGAGYLEYFSAPRRYRWRVTPNQTDITKGFWTIFGNESWPLENIPGKRRTNFLMRPPLAGTGLYNRFTGPAYIEYGPKWLKNAGIFEVHSKKSFENIFSAYSRPGSISKNFSALNDRFYIGEEEVDPFALPFYTENINVLNPPRKKFITQLDDRFAYPKNSVAVIANDYEILRDLFYSDELLLDFLIGKNPSDEVDVVEDITKQPIYDFNESFYLKSIFTGANEATIAKDRFYGSELVHAVDFFPKKEEFLELSQSNHRLINNLSPETSFILSGSNKLSTKVDFIRNEISQDSTNVEGFATKSSGLKTFFITKEIFFFEYNPPVIVSVPISIQNLLSTGEVIKNYSISSINVIGPAEVELRVKNSGQGFKSYSSGNNIWKEASNTYKFPTLEIEAVVPYPTLDGGIYYRSAFNSLKIEVTFDITLTGGDIEFTGDPSEFPFVNNIQSADPGSAFIHLYCPGYFLELYVGEEGTYATF